MERGRINATWTEPEVLEAVEGRLKDLLAGLEVVRTRRAWVTPSGLRVDLAVDVRAGRTRALLLLEVKSSGEPRLALAACAQLRRTTREVRGAYPVFCAPFVTESSRRLLVEEGVGYLDLSGNAHLRFGSVLIDRVGASPPIPKRRGVKELLAPKATRVLRALLLDPGRPAGLTEIARRCRMSPAGVFLVARLLEDKGFVERDRERRVVLTRPRELLALWAQSWSIERNGVARYFSLARFPEELIDQIGALARREGLPYALTLHAGASLVAPFVRFNDVWFYAPGDPLPWVEGLELKPAEAGANVFLMEPYDEGALDGARQVRGKTVVSDVQLYVDLYNFPARGREQAEALRGKTLTFKGAAP